MKGINSEISSSDQDFQTLKKTTNPTVIIVRMEVSQNQKKFIVDREREGKWIRRNVCMKECRSFKEDSDNNGFCMCGRKASEHNKDISATPCLGEWSLASADCIASPTTTAYGEIKFANGNIAKFVRVADDIDMDDMMHLLTDLWGLTKPNLLISVTGGAKDISMSKKLQDAFKKGLRKTAQTSGAWVLSGGTNHGVMKYVGDAVNILLSSHRVVALGIAPWGCIMNRKELTAPEGVWPAHYQQHEEETEYANLDQNHTHFILVDNGTFRKFGTEINFRGLLERYISKMKTDDVEASAPNVPVVSVVVEGGPGTLKTVKAAIDNATPVVVLNNSGRAADTLAYAYNNMDTTTLASTSESVPGKPPQMPDDVKVKLVDKVKMTWPKTTDRKVDELVDMITQSVMQRHLMVIFSLSDAHSMTDIDIAILQAIMKAKKDDDMNQFKLAVTWNRIDILREELLGGAKKLDDRGREDILQTALLQDKSDFVKLLMEHVSLATFLTKKRLLELYNSVQSTNLLYKVLEAAKKKNHYCSKIPECQNTSLVDVGVAIQSIIGDFYSPLYKRDPRYNSLDTDYILKETPKERHDDNSARNKVAPSTEHGSKNRKPVYDFEWPARELFLWCVLMRRKKLAMLFFNEENYAIAPLLTASMMLRGMESYTTDSEVKSEIEDIASEFKRMAIGVLGVFSNDIHQKSKILLIRGIPSYGDTTLLRLAVEAKFKEFVGHDACQNLLPDIWWGKISQNQNELKVTTVGALPFLWPFIPCLIKFLAGQELKESLPKQMMSKSEGAQKPVTLSRATPRETLCEQSTEKSPNNLNFQMDKEKGNEIEEASGSPSRMSLVSSMVWKASHATRSAEEKSVEELSTVGKYIAFFSAPKVTFITHTTFHVAFQLLFTYMMLCDYYPERQNLSWIEITVAVWFATLLIEELRQFYLIETNSITNRVWLRTTIYFNDVWNLVDIGAVIMFVIGFTLRVVDHTSVVTKRTAHIEQMLKQRSIDELDEWRYFRDDDSVIIADRLSYSRVILCLALMLVWFKVLHIFSFGRSFGPKLVMIRRMIKDLVEFFAILSVYIAAFGIAQHAIMFPNEPLSGVMIYRTLRLAYWQMYGELFLDDIEGENMDNCVERCTDDKFCFSVRDYLVEFGMNRTCSDGTAPIDKLGNCGDNSTIGCYGGVHVPSGLPKTAFPERGFIFCYTNSSGKDIPLCEDNLDRCPEVNRAVPVMLAVYILFTQILMFNLLIAMFSYTFTKIQEKADVHFKFAQYAMIKEYCMRTPTPPPFIVINHIVLFVKLIIRKCRHIEKTRDPFKIWLDEASEKQMASWEKISYEEYVRKQEHKKLDSIDSKVTHSKQEIDHLIDINQSLPQRMETGEALNWIMNALSKNPIDKGPPPMMKLKDEGTSQMEVLDAEENP